MGRLGTEDLVGKSLRRVLYRLAPCALWSTEPLDRQLLITRRNQFSGLHPRFEQAKKHLARAHFPARAAYLGERDSPVS